MSQRRKIPRLWKIALAALGIVAIILVVAVVWIAIWLQSESGQARIADMISRMASSDTTQVRLEKLLITPSGMIRLRSFEIGDKDGVWLKGENLEARLDFFELINKKVLIEYARVQSVNMARSPQGGPPDKETKPFRLVIPPLPLIEAHNVEVNRAVIGPAVLGDAQVLSLKAYADLGGDTSVAVLEIDRMEGPQGHARIRAELDKATQRLGLNVSVKEAPEGFIPKLVGAPTSDFAADLTGEGPVDRFVGQIKLSAAEAGEINADFVVRQKDAMTVDLNGDAKLRPDLLPEQFQSLAAEPTHFSLRFTTDDSGYSVENLEIDALSARLSASAKADSNLERVVGDFRLETLQPPPPEMLYGLALEPGTRLSGSLTEAEGVHTLTLTAALPGVEYKDMRAKGAKLEAQVSNTGGIKSPLAGLRASGDLGVAELRLSKGQEPFRDIQAQFHVDLPNTKLLNIQSLEVSSPWLQSKISGRLGLSDSNIDADADIRIADLSQTPVQTGLSGALRLSSKVKGLLSSPDLSIVVDGELTDLGGLPASAMRLTGDRLTLAAKVAVQQSQLRFQEVTVKGLSTLTADGRLDLNKRVADAAFRAALPEKIEFPFSTPLTVSGPTTIQGNLSGPLDGFDIGIQAEASKLESGGQVVSHPRLNLKMSGIPARIKGRADLEAETTGGPVTAAGDFQLDKSVFQISSFQAKAPGAEISATASIHTQTGLTDGRADFAIKDLGLIGMFTGMKMAGSSKGTAQLAARQNVQLADIDIEASQLAIDNIRIDRLTVKAQDLALTGAPSGQARLDAVDVQSGELRFKKAGLTIASQGKAINIDGRAIGAWNGPISLSFAALLEKTGSATYLSLNRFSGKIGKHGFNQAGALRVYYSAKDLSLKGLNLTIDSGRVQGDIELSGERIASNLQITSLPLEIATLFSDTGLIGSIDGRINLTGPVKSPTGAATLQIKGVRPAGPDYKTVPPLSVSLNLNLARDILMGKADISGLSKDPGHADFTLPMKFSLKPFSMSIPEGGTLTGSVSAKVDLSLLPVLLSLDNQTLTGTAQADLKVSGQMKNPQISGQVIIADGRYVNARVGALFDRINAEIKANGSRLEITKLTATDGEGGQITGQGDIDVASGGQFPYRLALNFQGAKLIRLDIINARCWGDISLTGNAHGADLKGAVKTDPIVLTIPEKSGPDIPDLEIREINAPTSEEVPQEKKPEERYRLNLDIGIDMPGRAYVRGRGLDTEWQGKLKIQGSSSNPRVRGRLDLVRGRFDFLGRTFRLTEGTLVFSGNSPPLPFINVTGEAVTGEITALVSITGPATSPKLELLSTPQLPQDEILSRVLFGRNLNTISAIQALRLAQAANQLAGGGGPNLDLLGKARETLQLDDLDIGQTDEGGSTVGVGKYISEDIYVRAEKDLSPSDGSVTVEIEVGPSFSLETQTGGSSGGKFGVNWKKDY